MEGFRLNSCIVSASPEETKAFGECLGRNLQRGSVVALRGVLGSGKTCLVKGIAKGLGIAEEITSPTYTIVSEYTGGISLYHIDAYRLSGIDDFTALGGEDYLYGSGISVIEWSERIETCLPDNTLFVDIEIQGCVRLIRISNGAV
ncbi:MAG: tRNA (adenosine(37)-N6)-threonylcarbamoyltransferase complex ATPase subunit type 1 TsaE [Treponema sp.]|jgi:tRNA threonylcarbamoyladenosine biosynthesis protein TsaE|nr:tRNA (adenosine(37)-N6)-threonylcarbamoyltransferase complex ATPase subunit type 1 TsaE [Treponema sp.]